MIRQYGVGTARPHSASRRSMRRGRAVPAPAGECQGAPVSRASQPAGLLGISNCKFQIANVAMPTPSLLLAYKSGSLGVIRMNTNDSSDYEKEPLQSIQACAFGASVPPAMDNHGRRVDRRSARHPVIPEKQEHSQRVSCSHHGGLASDGVSAR